MAEVNRELFLSTGSTLELDRPVSGAENTLVSPSQAKLRCNPPKNGVTFQKAKSFKAGSKINQLADMLAKRSLKMAETCDGDNNATESTLDVAVHLNLPAEQPLHSQDNIEHASLSSKDNCQPELERSLTFHPAQSKDEPVISPSPLQVSPSIASSDSSLSMNSADSRKSLFVTNNSMPSSLPDSFSKPNLSEQIQINCSKAVMDYKSLVSDSTAEFEKTDPEGEVPMDRDGLASGNCPPSALNLLLEKPAKLVSQAPPSSPTALSNSDDSTKPHPVKTRSSPRNKQIGPLETDVTPRRSKVKKVGKRSKQLVEMSTQTAEIQFISIVNDTDTPSAAELPKSKNESDDSCMNKLELKPSAEVSPTFLCLFCQLPFTEKTDCLNHEATHTLKRKTKFLKCQFCSKKLPNLEDFKDHCSKHHSSVFHLCSECDLRFYDNDSLIHHTKTDHNTVERTHFDIFNRRVKSSASVLDIDVACDVSKKPSISPRGAQKSSPKEKSEEQLYEAEMLFYSHLSGNIQENLSNHLDGKIDRQESSVDAVETIKAPGNLLTVVANVNHNGSVPVCRAPSPYQTRSKTPNPLPTSAKKFKKLPNWQQKFWEKYNFPTNYRFEHRFWDKNYINTERSQLYLKDLSCLDIKTQLTMRENVKKLENTSEIEKDTSKQTFPNFLDLMTVPITPAVPETVTPCTVELVKLPKKKSRDNKGSRRGRYTGEGNLPQVVTRRQSVLDVAKQRKGSLDFGAEKKMTLRRQTSVEILGEDSSKDSAAAVESTVSSSIPKDSEIPDEVFVEKSGISGEWVRARSYLCGACCAKFSSLWDLEDHKWAVHPNVWCTHYEFEVDKLDKLFHLEDEQERVAKISLPDLYRRNLSSQGSLNFAELPAGTSFPHPCSKCEKSCMSQAELHRHMLDCGGDTTWSQTMCASPATLKRRWRPYGSRRRKPTAQRGVKRTITSTPPLRTYITQPKIRTKPGDVESIQKMLANLPEKRTRRAINFDEVNTRSQTTIHSNRLLRKRHNGFGSNRLREKVLTVARQRRQARQKDNDESSSKCGFKLKEVTVNVTQLTMPPPPLAETLRSRVAKKNKMKSATVEMAHESCKSDESAVAKETKDQEQEAEHETDADDLSFQAPRQRKLLTHRRGYLARRLNRKFCASKKMMKERRQSTRIKHIAAKEDSEEGEFTIEEEHFPIAKLKQVRGEKDNAEQSEGANESDQLKLVVKKLSKKELRAANLPAESSLIHEAGPAVLENASVKVAVPKLRSKKSAARAAAVTAIEAGPASSANDTESEKPELSAQTRQSRKNQITEIQEAGSDAVVTVEGNKTLDETGTKRRVKATVLSHSDEPLPSQEKVPPASKSAISKKINHKKPSRKRLSNKVIATAATDTLLPDCQASEVSDLPNNLVLSQKQANEANHDVVISSDTQNESQPILGSIDANCDQVEVSLLKRSSRKVAGELSESNTMIKTEQVKLISYPTVSKRGKLRAPALKRRLKETTEVAFRKSDEANDSDLVLHLVPNTPPLALKESVSKRQLKKMSSDATLTQQVSLPVKKQKKRASGPKILPKKFIGTDDSSESFKYDTRAQINKTGLLIDTNVGVSGSKRLSKNNSDSTTSSEAHVPDNVPDGPMSTDAAVDNRPVDEVIPSKKEVPAVRIVMSNNEGYVNCPVPESESFNVTATSQKRLPSKLIAATNSACFTNETNVVPENIVIKVVRKKGGKRKGRVAIKVVKKPQLAVQEDASSTHKIEPLNTVSVGLSNESTEVSAVSVTQGDDYQAEIRVDATKKKLPTRKTCKRKRRWSKKRSPTKKIVTEPLDGMALQDLEAAETDVTVKESSVIPETVSPQQVELDNEGSSFANFMMEKIITDKLNEKPVKRKANHKHLKPKNSLKRLRMTVTLKEATLKVLDKPSAAPAPSKWTTVTSPNRIISFESSLPVLKDDTGLQTLVAVTDDSSVSHDSKEKIYPEPIALKTRHTRRLSKFNDHVKVAKAEPLPGIETVSPPPTLVESESNKPEDKQTMEIVSSLPPDFQALEQFIAPSKSIVAEEPTSDVKNAKSNVSFKPYNTSNYGQSDEISSESFVVSSVAESLDKWKRSEDVSTTVPSIDDVRKGNHAEPEPRHLAVNSATSEVSSATEPIKSMIPIFTIEEATSSEDAKRPLTVVSNCGPKIAEADSTVKIESVNIVTKSDGSSDEARAEPEMVVSSTNPAVPTRKRKKKDSVVEFDCKDEVPSSTLLVPEELDRRSRRKSKEVPSTNEFIIDDPLLLVDELWSDLDSDSDSKKKRLKKVKKKTPRKRVPKKEVDLEALLRNFGENKDPNERIKCLPKRRKVEKSLTLRQSIENKKVTNNNAYKRFSLSLFKFNKNVLQFGRRGAKLLKVKKTLTPLKRSLKLPSEVKENPEQVIVCRLKRSGLGKKKKPEVKSDEIKLDNQSVRVSLSLDLIGDLSILNNNHIGQAESLVQRHETLAPSTSESKPKPQEAKLKRIVSDCIDKVFYCEICKTYYYSFSQLRLHKLSNRHKQNELQLTEKQPSSDIADESADTLKEPLFENKESALNDDLNSNSPPGPPSVLDEVTSTLNVPVVEASQPFQDKNSDDSSEMPILEGPFLESRIEHVAEPLIVPAVTEPSTVGASIAILPAPPAQSVFGFSEESLKDIQKAIGCTDEEMLILTLLGENSAPEPDILDLSNYTPKAAKAQQESPVNQAALKPNGLLKIDLKQRMTTALASLVNRAVDNLLNKNVSKIAEKSDALTFLNKLTLFSGRKKLPVPAESSSGEQPSTSEAKENTEEKYQFKCKYCGNRFEKESTRDCHYARSHTKRVKGNKAEAEESADDWHNWTDHDDADLALSSQFWCSDCGINFVSPKEVLEHQKSVHATEPVRPASDDMGGLAQRRGSTLDPDQEKLMATQALRNLSKRATPRKSWVRKSFGLDALRFKKVAAQETCTDVSDEKPGRLLQRKPVVREATEKKNVDVYDFNEFDSDPEPIVLNHVKKSVTIKEQERCVSNDEDSDDNIPLSSVKKPGASSAELSAPVTAPKAIEPNTADKQDTPSDRDSFKISLENRFIRLDEIPLKNSPSGSDDDSLPLMFMSRKDSESDNVKNLPVDTDNEIGENVIYQHNDSVSSFESAHNQESNPFTSVKSDSESEETTKSRRHKRVVPSLSATLPDATPKETALNRIWNRPTDYIDDIESDVDKEMIMKKVWKKKRDVEKIDDGDRSSNDSIKIKQTEISSEVVIKCGPPKEKPHTRKKSLDENAKSAIVRRIWSGKCGIQTKAALKTYDTDIVPMPVALPLPRSSPPSSPSRIQSLRESPPANIASASAPRRRRPAAAMTAKRKKLSSASEDDLDSLLDEIEQENVEKAIRLEFLHLRRSEKGQNEPPKEPPGLFSENAVGDEKQEKKKRKTTKKVRVLKRRSELNDLSRRHRKHRHRHHHHKHKHKKSKHHKGLLDKHKSKHRTDELMSVGRDVREDMPFRLLERMCEDIASRPDCRAVSHRPGADPLVQPRISTDLDNLDLKLDEILSPHHSSKVDDGISDEDM